MSTQYSKEQLLEFLEQFFKEVYHTNNKLNLYMFLYNKLADKKDVSEIAPTYFSLTLDALHNDFMVRIAKLFDNSRGSYGTMFKVLNVIEANANLFSTENKKILLQVRAHRKVFQEDYNSLIKNIKTWRDRLYVHFDKPYFFDKDRLKLGKDAPMNYGEIITLLKTAVNTINYYNKLLDESLYILENQGVTMDTDTIIGILSNAIKE